MAHADISIVTYSVVVIAGHIIGAAAYLGSDCGRFSACSAYILGCIG